MTTRHAAAALLALLAACGDATVRDPRDTAPGATEADANAPGPAPGDAPAPAAAEPVAPAAPRAGRARPPREDDPDSLALRDPDPLPESAEALEALLLAALRDDAKPAGMRGHSLDEVFAALGRIPDDAAIPVLLRLLRVDETAHWVCGQLAERRVATPEVVAALVARIRSDAVRGDEEISAADTAGWALSRLGPAGIDAARALLADCDPRIAAHGLGVLGAWRPMEGVAFPTADVAAAATRSDVFLRQLAAAALRSAPAGDAAATRTLVDLALAPEDDVRRMALHSMAFRSSDFAPHADALVRLAEANADHDTIPGEVAYVLCNAGPAATLAMLASASPVVRAEAARQADPSDAAVRDRLAALLEDPDVRAPALRTLAECDDPPVAVREIAVESVRTGGDERTRAAAAAVCGSLLARGAIGVDPLLAALGDASPKVRAAAALALAKGCPEAERSRVLAALRLQWTDERLPRWARVSIAADFGALDGPGTSALGVLADAAKDGLQEGFDGLVRVGTKEAVDELLSWLGTVRWDRRLMAIRALGALAASDARIVPALVRELETAPRTGVRAVAAEELAPHRADPGVFRALRAAARSEYADVARAAKAALGDDAGGR